MPFHWTLVCSATAAATVVGLVLAYLLAVLDVRAVGFAMVPLLPIPMVVLAGLRSPAAVPAAAVVTGLPFVALISARRFREIDRTYGNSARSCGASEWRLFWRVLLPLAWKTVVLAGALAFARIATESAIAANL